MNRETMIIAAPSTITRTPGEVVIRDVLNCSLMFAEISIGVSRTPRTTIKAPINVNTVPTRNEAFLRRVTSGPASAVLSENAVVSAGIAIEMSAPCSAASLKAAAA